MFEREAPAELETNHKEKNRQHDRRRCILSGSTAVQMPTGGAARFLMILKISDFCQKFEFWVFWRVTGGSGSLEMSIFLVFGRSQNFDFFGFFWSV